jgi:Integrase zinc binding domain
MLGESNIKPWEAQPPSLTTMVATCCYDAHLSVLPDLAHDHLRLCALSSTAAHDKSPEPSNNLDVWHDKPCLQFLRTAKLPPALSTSDQKRILRRSKLYVFVGNALHRRMKDGSERIVPPPADRISNVQQIHARTGLFGQKRTRHLVLHSYWWKGVEQDVFKVIKTCEVCARVNTSFFCATA